VDAFWIPTLTHNAILVGGGFRYARNTLLTQAKRLAADMALNVDSTYVCWLDSDVLWWAGGRADNQSTPRKDREYFEQVKWRLTEPAYKLFWNGSLWNHLEHGLLCCLSSNIHWTAGHNFHVEDQSTLPDFELDF